MGFKFRKKIKIAPGISVNISKNGITSATIGKPGSSVNVGKRGVKATTGIPGTGLSYTSGNLLGGKSEHGKQNAEAESVHAQALLYDDSNDPISTPTLPLVLTNKQFRKLSKEDKKSFKKAGGKIKLSTGEKIFIAIVIALGIGWLSSKHSTERPPTATSTEASTSIK
ncbi:DUF4236 domain-containing protein [Kluyvera cryocrescens]|uniref:DUF4236 domain-containing protein n=1 Tax=Kluyvera cryocrescens TaxID=580 RepID=UPI000773C920|nr:DUF4236 domain-containing protein [Kluyvera cryocrescens]HDG1688227.1 DUF4236 domain-containing protein [Kluyvera cryocrescens]